MISIFSEAVRLTCRSSRHDPSDFFEHTIIERDLGDDFLELPVLGSQPLDFIAGSFAHGVYDLEFAAPA